MHRPHPELVPPAPARAAAADLAVAMTEEQLVGDVTLRLLDPEVFPEATVRSHWMDRVAAGGEEAWIAPVLAPGMTCLTAGPEETTLHQHHDTREEVPGALMMRAAAAGEVEQGEEEVEAGLINLQATPSTNPDRNQEQRRMSATL